MDFAEMVRGVFGDMGGSQEATAFAVGNRLPAAHAGFVNGAYAHGPDYDDTHSVAMVHIGCTAVPSSLAMAERQRASGAEMLTAMIAGAEVGLRIGAAAPHRFHHRGLHATSVVGPFTSAMASGRLLRLDAERVTNALGLAGRQSSGLLVGVPGAPRPGAGGPGRTDRPTAALGERWFPPDTTYKPYSNGAWNHSSMDAVVAIMRDHHLQHQEIARIDAAVPLECLTVVCEPRDAKIHPRTPYHMKFSLPYSVAIVAVLGHADIDDYTDEIFANAEIADLAARTFCHGDPGMPPARFPARVTVETKGGERFERDVPAQRGGPGNPFRPEDHRAKFRANAGPSLGQARTHELLGSLENAWASPSVAEITRLMAAPA